MISKNKSIVGLPPFEMFTTLSSCPKEIHNNGIVAISIEKKSFSVIFIFILVSFLSIVYVPLWKRDHSYDVNIKMICIFNLFKNPGYHQYTATPQRSPI